MEAVGVAATLAVVAAQLISKILSFKGRMANCCELLDGLVKSCQDVEWIANMIEMELAPERELANPQTAKEGDSWHLLAFTLEALKSLFIEFEIELDQLTAKSAETRLGKILLQLKTDKSPPRIIQIQAEIRNKYHVLCITVPFALQRRASIPTRTSPNPPEPPNPPRPPEPKAPATPKGKLSAVSKVKEATKQLNFNTVKRLLDKDVKGDLIKTTDSSGRTLLDIAIYHGKPTSGSLIPMVKLLHDRGAQFTMVNDTVRYKAFNSILSTIHYQTTMKK